MKNNQKKHTTPKKNHVAANVAKRVAAATKPVTDHPGDFTDETVETFTSVKTGPETTTSQVSNEPTPAEVAAARADEKATRRAQAKADRDAKNAARKADREAKVAARKAERERLRAQLAPRDVYVSDREYFLAKGSLPFGHARWEFSVDPRHAKRDTDVFAYTGKFGPAKQAAKKHFAALDINSVEVVVPAPTSTTSTANETATNATV